jgi:hypothetical protein
MKPAILYRLAAVLLLLFAAGHLFGFTQSDPKWGVDAMLAEMHSIRFDMGGFQRTWWDFYLAAGLSAGLFYMFAAVLAWQLGGLTPETRAQMRGVPWAFAAAFAAIAAVSWIYLFLIPILFSTAITLCLAAAAWVSSSARP